MIGFGTDAATPFSKHGEQAKEFALMHQFGMEPVKTLLAATKVNAKLLQKENEIGSIEKGKYADIVAFATNPLNDLSTMENCTFVMKDGCIHKQL